MTTREQGQVSADSSVAQLVERLSAQVSALVRDEMALATAEMKRKGAQAGVGIGIGSAVVALLARGSELGYQVLERGSELRNQVVERGNEWKTQVAGRGREIRGQAGQRGSELKDQAIAAGGMARESVSRASTGQWATLACAGLALIVLTVIARKVRVW